MFVSKLHSTDSHWGMNAFNFWETGPKQSVQFKMISTCLLWLIVVVSNKSTKQSEVKFATVCFGHCTCSGEGIEHHDILNLKRSTYQLVSNNNHSLNSALFCKLIWYPSLGPVWHWQIQLLSFALRNRGNVSWAVISGGSLAVNWDMMDHTAHGPHTCRYIFRWLHTSIDILL